MKNVNPHLLEDKMDEAVTHYITHQSSESVHADASSLALNIQDDEGGRVLTIMNTQNFAQQMCRPVSVSVSAAEPAEAWGSEALEDGRLAALVAQLAKAHAPHFPPTNKLTSARNDMESSVMLDGQLRLFNAHTLEQEQSESLVVQMPLPPLQDMKHCDADWFNKAKNNLKSERALLAPEPRPSKKSLPHKKRISRKLRRNTTTAAHQDIVVISCDAAQEEILPDYAAHAQPLHDHGHAHVAHEVRPVLICCLCGEYYGEEQLKFYHHLKQHYEPHDTIIIENPVSDLGMDKIPNSCIEDNAANLPDSIVELSLENTVPKTMYQVMDKHILYTSSEKPLYSNKVQYSMANMEKEVASEAEKADLYETLDKLEMYNCMKCNRTFRKQKQCEAHMMEVHGKLEDMEEFSEPEDLMAGIHVAVEGDEAGADYEHTLLPHLTVENGTVHQEHVRHWWRGASAGAGAGAGVGAGAGAGEGAGACGAGCACAGPAAPPPAPAPAPPPAPPPPPAARAEPAIAHLKEEVFQRIFEVEVPAAESSNYAENMVPDEMPDPEPDKSDGKPDVDADMDTDADARPKKGKSFGCPQCGRVFQHRNSLLYHLLSHKGKQHVCRECNKGFYTSGALKIHKRVHNGDRPYKCEECAREFRQWSDLKYHKVSLHSDQKHFKCEFCGKEFARKYSLSVHRRIHTGERNYKCEFCNKSFRASSYRLSHMRTHTGDRPFKCALCGKGFRVAGDLRRHALTHDKLARDKHARDRPVRDKLARAKLEPDKSPKNNKTKDKKKVAAASTTKLPILKSILDKKSPKNKKDPKKLAAPNVTVGKDEQFKINDEFTNNVEVFDSRNYKFREIFVSKDEQIRHYEFEGRISDDRNFAVLKPMFRNGDSIEHEKIYDDRRENTDGKMAVFTEVEKKEYGSGASNSQVTLSDIRHLEREVRDVRNDGLNGEAIDNGLLEKLAALYNIPAV